MKKFILILISLVTFNALADYGRQGASNNASISGGLQNGTLEQQFINVKNKYGATIAAGSIAVWDVTNDDGYSVTLSITAFANPACMIVASCASNAWCKCQTYGYTDKLLFGSDTTGSTAAGDKIQLSEYAFGYVQAPTSLEARDSVIGVFYDASTTTGAVEAFLKLR